MLTEVRKSIKLIFYYFNSIYLLQPKDPLIEGIFKGGLRYILYTIIPSGFIVYVPAKVISKFNILLLAEVLVVTLLWIIIAYVMFYRDLKKYESGNLIINKL